MPPPPLCGMAVAIALGITAKSPKPVYAEGVDAWKQAGKRLCQLYGSGDRAALEKIAKNRGEKLPVRVRAIALVRDFGERSLDSLAIEIFPRQKKDIWNLYDLDFATPCGTGQSS